MVGYIIYTILESQRARVHITSRRTGESPSRICLSIKSEAVVRTLLLNFSSCSSMTRKNNCCDSKAMFFDSACSHQIK